jgi:hypothetical protein
VNWTIGAYTIDANELYAGDPYVGSTDQIPRTETQTQPVSSDSNNDNDDGGGNTEDEGQDVKDAQSGGGAILCNDPDWSGEGTCIDPSVPKCNGTDEICYTEDGDIKNLEKQPYCDEVSDGSGCWDRKDNDQDTGLYPCKDGSYKEDWRDCNGDDDNGNDNNNGEDDDNDRILPSCSNVVSGTACDNSGEEDSWLDDPTEYYTEDDIQDEEEYEEDDSTE